MKSKRLYYVIMPFIMAFTLIISLFAPLVPTDLSSAAVINGVTGLSANDATVTRSSDDKDFTGNSDTDPYTAYKVSYNWSIPDDAGEIKNGDTFTFKLPSNVKYNGGEIIVKNQSGDVVGTAAISGSTGTVTITNANALGRYGRKGTLEFNANGTSDKATHNWRIAKGGWSTKVGDEDRVQWQVMYNSTNESLKNVVITDTFGEGQKYISGSYQVLTGTVDEKNNFNGTGDITKDVKVSQNGNTLTFNIGNIDTAIEILYQTLPNKGFVGNLTNKAIGSADGIGDASTKDIEVAWGGSGTAEGYTANAELTKEDSKDGTKLSGAEFKLVDSNKSVIRTGLTTDENGKLTVKDLPEGDYAFIETNPPTGYTLDTTPHNFTVKQGGDNPVKITVTNKKKEKQSVGKATLTKVDANDKTKTLSGAVFKVINTDTNEVVKKDLTTNDQGQVVVDSLAKGNYAFVETAPPNGYQLDATEHKFTITGNVGEENSVELTATNKEIKSVGKATLTKVDANDSDKTLSGAVFYVIDKDNNNKVIETLTTDDNGQITADNLAKGSYAFKEVKAPKGYEVNNTEYLFKITGDKGSEGTYDVTVPDEASPTSITVNKSWNDGNDTSGRPSSVTVKLLANGTDTGKTVTLNSDNNWKAEFTGLDKKDSSGKEITYSVQEEVPDNYSSSAADPVKVAAGGSVTITNTPLTDITVTKEWEGDEGFEAFRKPVEVQLLQDDKEIATYTIDGTQNQDWHHTFTSLPKYDNEGNEYKYTVKEITSLTNYQEPIGAVEVKNGQATITNTYAPQKTQLTVKKVWDDNEDQDGERPSKVTVELVKNGKDTDQTKELTADNGWTATFDDLDKYDENGKEIPYTVKELNVDKNYTASVGGVTTENGQNKVIVTNTHTPETTSIAVDKIWEDKENQDGKQPDSVTVKLLANGEDTGKTVTLSGDNDWEASFDNLPVYENGQKITYSVKEVNVPDGYTSSGGTVTNGKATITNAYTPETTNIEVNKTWDDNNNVDGVRPDSVTVKLFADGTDTGKTVTLSEKNEWKDSFKDLAVYKNGTKINYTVQETGVPNSYTSTASNPVAVSGNSITITNTHKQDTTDLKVNKKWIGGDLLRPSEVQVQLLANNQVKRTETLNLGNNWTYDFTNLPVNDENGKINYTVKEVDVPDDYTSTTETTGNAVTITNTYKPGKTQLNVSKVWNDTNNQDKLRPNKITVQLYKTVGKTTTAVDGKTAELTAENKWTADFTDLDATDSDGNPITYTAKEVSVPKGYSEKYKYSDDGKSETITNTHPAEETTSLTVNKVWNDKKTSHPSVQVQLYKVDGDKKTAVGDPVTLSDEAGWSHTFDKLAKDATYTVEEVNSPSGYISEVSKAVNGKVTITNTPEAKTQVTVNKVWNDSNDKDHKRPTSVEAQLYANGDKSGDAVKLTANENWTHTWTDLPQNDSKGNKITYTVKEVDVPEGYAASYKTDGNVTTITNTYPAPETTSLKVNKVWKNGDPNLRPNEVQVQLYANGEKSGEPITLNQGNAWSYDFKDLVKNDDNGEPIKYTVEEVTKVQNYTPTQIVNGNAVTITNTYTPNKTQLTVNKAWNDNDNKSNLRPSAIQIQLYANDQKSGSPVTINPDKDGNWSYTFDNLDETDASGKKITYTAKEVGVPEGYGATYEYSKDGKTETITNTHPAPQTKKLTVDKIWNDNRSNHSAVKVQLYKVDGKNKTVVGEPVTLSSKDGWSYTFTDLAKDSNYTVEEVDVPNGYTSQVSSVTNGKITITNTLKKTSLTVNKVWNDSKNKTGKRPSSIQVQLYANDKKSGDPVTIKPNKDGDWTYTFQNLDEVDENGKTISYKAEEVNVPEGYASTSKTDGNVTTITNTYPAPETTSFKVTKDWEDNNNEYGLRPNEVTVQLLANGKAYGEPIVLNQGNNWTYEFTGLPKADAEGYPMTYSVKEITNLANYNSSVDTSQSGQTTIVNTVIPPVYPTSEKTQLTVNKVWNDNNNQDGKRPSEVTVQLLANGKETGKSVELSDKNNWVATFSDLDKTDNSRNPISYTVKEVKVDGYTTKVDKVKDGQVTITNTRDTDTTVPPTKSTTPSQPTTPPVKSTTPGQPIVPPVKSTKTTPTTEKTNKPKTFTDKVKQVVSGLLPQTGADKTNAIITYVGLLLVVIVIISWVMIAKRRRDK